MNTFVPTWSVIMVLFAAAAVPVLVTVFAAPPHLGMNKIIERPGDAPRARGTTTITSSSGATHRASADPPLSPLIVPAGRGAGGQRAEFGGIRSGWFKRMLSEWRQHDEFEGLSPPRSAEAAPVTDALLVSRCRSLLLGEPALRNLWIHVTANQGLVILRGQLPSEEARRQVESVAAKTSGARGVVNELTVGSDLNQVRYVPATLSAPRSLEGNPLHAPNPRALPEMTGPVAAMPNSSGVAAPAVSLGQPVRLDGLGELPRVRTYVIERSQPVVATTWSTLPPAKGILHQQVAKATAGPEVLPSGHRVGTGRRAGVIPAPGGTSWSREPMGMANASPQEPGRPMVKPRGEVDSLEQRITGDVAALLSLDPRASSLKSVVRGTEVRLSGRARSPEDLFDLSARINNVPGVDVVSFDDVRFSN